MATKPLIDLVVEVRAASGRPLDAAGLERMENKIVGYTTTEATAQRNTLNKLLDHFNRMPSVRTDDRP